MARHIVIGTAGHVDHGKTTLVKALTGIDTDTTKEEKQRGLTINLGFAYMDLPNGVRVGIVDVPGHERFIKNMVAGLPGLSLVLLVVDANEGVMPQTIEHMDILTLLGIKTFLIVITKADTVDEDMLLLVEEDIRAKLADTAAAGADIIETDALTGRGISALIQKIQDVTSQLTEPQDKGEARLNIDRVFTVRGFGTVVTGTLLDGTVSVGDELMLYPQRRTVRVRNIQVHEQNVESASAGQRTALNVVNVSREDIHRGDVLCASCDLKPTRMVDVKAACLSHSTIPIKMWDRLRLLIGTQEVMVRAVPLGQESILPGQEGFMQLRIEKGEIVVKEKDRFILRTFSPMHTIGGGTILDACPRKHRRFRADVLESLMTKDSGRLDEMACDYLLHHDGIEADSSELAARLGVSVDEVDTVMVPLVADHMICKTPTGYVHKDRYKAVKGKAIQVLMAYHRANPLRSGMPVGEFRARMKQSLSEKECESLLFLMNSDGGCRIENHIVAASQFHVVFSPAQTAARRAIENILKKAGYTPVKVSDLLTQGKDVSIVLDAMKGDAVVFLTPEYVLSRSYYEAAVEMLTAYVQQHGRIELAAFRDLIQSGRKAALLILDYMDEQHVTRRAGSYRILDTPMQKAEGR